ncbi:hypothetical protein [Flammeovirga aprica]|uniref:Uncharacterized protein n=1 Tax=Flammeovirga aprica JL-4 TaxID=694437 RepID=A0A7X9RTR6_9BACT|nr:hypothetical protein [Flammeovirga aprica]NME67744.1 hypothetical protein [Flammeovirga aprica JL-4]
MKNIKSLNISDEAKDSIQHHAVHLRRLTNTHVDLKEVNENNLKILIDISESSLPEEEAIERGENVFKYHLTEDYNIQSEIKKFKAEKESTAVIPHHFGITPSKNISGTTISSTEPPFYTCEVTSEKSENVEAVLILGQQYFIKCTDYDTQMTSDDLKINLKNVASFCSNWFDEFGYMLELK